MQDTYARGITFYNNFIIYTVIKFSTYCVINSCKLPLPYLIAQSQSSNATSFYNKNIMSFTKQQTYFKNKWYTKVDFTTLKAEQIPTKRSVAHVEWDYYSFGESKSSGAPFVPLTLLHFSAFPHFFATNTDCGSHVTLDTPMTNLSMDTFLKLFCILIFVWQA